MNVNRFQNAFYNVTDQKNVIKTYSKRKPVVVYESAALLIPRYPDPESRANVRESQLNDKTLIVDDFDDTFDKLTETEEKLDGQTDLPENENKSYSNNVFKVPLQVQKKTRKAKLKNNEDEQPEILKVAKSQKKRPKRKKNSNEDSDEDFENDRIDKPKEKVRKITNKDENTPVIVATQHSNNKSEETTPINRNDESFTLANDSKSFAATKVSTVFNHLLSNNISSSTPREQRLRKFVNVHNLSPIPLEKENRTFGNTQSRFSKDKVSNEHDVLKESNTNINSDELIISGSTEKLNNPDENELSAMNPPSIDNTVLQTVTTKSTSDTKLSNRTPSIDESRNQVTSYVDSPLLFDDSQDIHEKINTSVDVPCNVQRLDFDNNDNSQNTHTRSDSSYSPHDWSNEYDSSYEYFKDPKEKSKIVTDDGINSNRDDVASNNLTLKSSSQNDESSILSNEDGNKIPKSNDPSQIDNEEHDINEDGSEGSSFHLVDQKSSIEERNEIDSMKHILQDDTCHSVPNKPEDSMIEGSNKIHGDENMKETCISENNENKTNDQVVQESQLKHVLKIDDPMEDNESPILTRRINKTKKNKKKSVRESEKHNIDELKDESSNEIDQNEKINKILNGKILRIVLHKMDDINDHENIESNLISKDVKTKSQRNSGKLSLTKFVEKDDRTTDSKSIDSPARKSNEITSNHIEGSMNNESDWVTEEEIDINDTINDFGPKSVSTSRIIKTANSDELNDINDETLENDPLDSSMARKNPLQRLSDSSNREKNAVDMVENNPVSKDNGEVTEVDLNDLSIEKRLAFISTRSAGDKKKANSRSSEQEMIQNIEPAEESLESKTQDVKNRSENTQNKKLDVETYDIVDTRLSFVSTRSTRNKKSREIDSENIKNKSPVVSTMKNSNRKKRKQECVSSIVDNNEGSQIENYSVPKEVSPVSIRLSKKKKSLQEIEGVNQTTKSSSRKKSNITSRVQKSRNFSKSNHRVQSFSDIQLNDTKKIESDADSLIAEEEESAKQKLTSKIAQCKELRVIIPRLNYQSINKVTHDRKKSKSSSKKSVNFALMDKIIQNNTIPDNNDESMNKQELCDILSKLNDPIKISSRRNRSKRWGKSLAAISEVQQNSEEENEIPQKQSKSLFRNASDQDHPIFLMPGKSWARSLSIINRFYKGQNLDEFEVGRGKNWRQSVQTILSMQPEDTIRYSIRENDEEKSHASQSLRVSQASQRDSAKVSSIITSPSRFSRRFSVRIIPSGEEATTLTDDFIESLRVSSIHNRTRKTSSSSSRKNSLKIKRNTLIETEDDLIRSARDIILKRCKQTDYVPFEVSFPDSYIEKCTKIGEGVYGEVFLYEDEEEKFVIKIIPIEGTELVNSEPQKKFHEILTEVIITEELHKLRYGDEYNTSGFVGINRINCVIGKYPKKLIDLWNAYDEKKRSENDCPSMFGEDQLYIILELAHGGQDLEAYKFKNATESFSIFLQCAHTLAVAERSLEFEHRDLHWGNLLIAKTDEEDVSYKLGSESIELPTEGVKVTVIDFTLSRMSYRGCKIFNDLAADPALFTAQGEYQFEIYRLMRDTVGNDWQRFNPYTNILWLDYILQKMTTKVRYTRKTSNAHKDAISKMKELREVILDYDSAFDFISKCEKIKVDEEESEDES